MHANPRECFEGLKESLGPAVGSQLKDQQNNSGRRDDSHVNVQRCYN